MENYERIINDVIDKYKKEVDEKFPNLYLWEDTNNRENFCLFNRDIMGEQIKEAIKEHNIDINNDIIKTAVVVALNKFSDYCSSRGRL